MKPQKTKKTHLPASWVECIVSRDDAWIKQREGMVQNGMPHSAVAYAKIAFDAAWVMREHSHPTCPDDLPSIITHIDEFMGTMQADLPVWLLTRGLGNIPIGMVERLLDGKFVYHSSQAQKDKYFEKFPVTG